MLRRFLRIIRPYETRFKNAGHFSDADIANEILVFEPPMQLHFLRILQYTMVEVSKAP